MVDNQEIVAVSLKEFVEQQGFTQLATNKVRRNMNEYPFLTFIDGNNEATNVYFSKNESVNIADKTELNSEYLRKLQVVTTTNAENEKRFKLTTGNSERINLSEIF